MWNFNGFMVYIAPFSESWLTSADLTERERFIIPEKETAYGRLCESEQLLFTTNGPAGSVLRFCETPAGLQYRMTTAR